MLISVELGMRTGWLQRMFRNVLHVIYGLHSCVFCVHRKFIGFCIMLSPNLGRAVMSCLYIQPVFWLHGCLPGGDLVVRNFALLKTWEYRQPLLFLCFFFFVLHLYRVGVGWACDSPLFGKVNSLKSFVNFGTQIHCWPIAVRCFYSVDLWGNGQPEGLKGFSFNPSLLLYKLLYKKRWWDR